MSYLDDYEKPKLPKSWQWVEYGDIFSIQGGGQPAKKHFVYEPTNSYIRLLQIRDFGDRPVPTYIPQDMATKFCKKEDVLIARYGASLGRILTGMEGAYNVAMAKVIFDEDFIYSRYVFYLLQTDFFQIPIHMISRSAQNGFNKGDIFPIPMPLAPVAEQIRIVDEIEKQFTRLDKAVEALERLKQNIQRYRASVLKHACEGRLVAQDPADEPAEVLLQRILTERRRRWEEETWQKEIERAQKKAAKAMRKAAGKSTRMSAIPDEEWQAIPESEYGAYLPRNDKWKQKYQEPERPDTEGLPQLPAGWVWATMDMLADIVSGVTKGKNFKDKETVMLPYLRVANVQQGYLDLDIIKEIEAQPSDLEKYRLEKDDLLLTEGGDWDKLGRSAIWQGQVEDCIHQNHIFRARPYLPDVPTIWLMYFTNSEHGRKYFANSAKQTTNLASINLTQLRACPIPLPPPNTQSRTIEEVERRLSMLDALEETVITNLTRAERLRQAVLKRAFSGQLVPQDPRDEPASELLKRIEKQKSS